MRIVRAAVPIVLVAAGIASVAYGVRGHVVRVVLKPEEIEETSPAPKDQGAHGPEEPGGGPPRDPWMSPPRDPWMGPPRDPWMSPPPGEPGTEEESPRQEAEEKAGAKEPEETTSDDREPVIIREVTVGGLSRLETGEIVRTYVGEKPPSLCPT